MKLIDYQGLNCHQNALITVAAYMGVDYPQAFYNLWPETDFQYDGHYKVYTTKRLYENLACLGIEREILADRPPAALSEIPEGESFLIAMDSFYVPWSMGFQIIHDDHYFVAQKEPTGRLACFDPTFDVKSSLEADSVQFISEIQRIKRTSGKALQSGNLREEILKGHPKMKRRLLEEMRNCKNAIPLAKYVDALINNRYLYRCYLDNTPSVPEQIRTFFDKNFFSRWNAIKNGLYKIHIAKENQRIIGEVSHLLENVMDDEMGLAAKAAFNES